MRLEVEQTEGDGEDAMQSAVWAAASVLADTMQQPSHFAEDHWRAKSVVELGSGCGLCGLMAAALGASRVLLTDLPPLLPLLRRNCDANRHVCGESELSVRSLEWGVTPCGGLLAEGEEWSEGLSEGDQEVSTPSTRGTPLLRRWDVCWALTSLRSCRRLASSRRLSLS